MTSLEHAEELGLSEDELNESSYLTSGNTLTRREEDRLIQLNNQVKIHFAETQLCNGDDQ